MADNYNFLRGASNDHSYSAEKLSMKDESMRSKISKSIMQSLTNQSTVRKIPMVITDESEKL